MPLSLREALEESLNRLQAGEERPEEIITSYPGLEDQLRVLLGVATELETSLPILNPSLDYQKAGRMALLQAARARRVERTSAPMIKRWAWQIRTPASTFVHSFRGLQTRLASRPRIAGALAVVMLFSGGMTVATANSLPGSPLYPIKVGVEQAQVAMTLSAEAKAGLQLNLAHKRLDEAELMLESKDEATLGRSFEAAGRHLDLASAAADELAAVEKKAVLAKISEFTREQRRILNAMLAKAPPAGKRAISKALADDNTIATASTMPGTADKQVQSNTSAGTSAPTTSGPTSVTGQVVPEIRQLLTSPNVFSPNNNQVKDFTAIVAVGARAQVLWAEIWTADATTVVRRLKLAADKDTPERYATTWDGRGADGKALPDGAYQLKIKNDTGGYTPLTANTVIDTTPPQAPVSLSPANESVVESPALTFAWKSQDDAEIFILQYSKDAGFAQEATVTVPDLTISFYPVMSEGELAEGIWYWRVRAIDSSGNIGAFSSAQKFTISAPITIQGSTDGPDAKDLGDSQESLPDGPDESRN